MAAINWPALVAGIVSVSSGLSLALGHPTAAAIISNPETASAATAVLGGLASLWSLFSPALLHSTTIAAAARIETK